MSILIGSGGKKVTLTNNVTWKLSLQSTWQKDPKLLQKQNSNREICWTKVVSVLAVDPLLLFVDKACAVKTTTKDPRHRVSSQNDCVSWYGELPLYPCPFSFNLQEMNKSQWGQKVCLCWQGNSQRCKPCEWGVHPNFDYFDLTTSWLSSTSPSLWMRCPRETLYPAVWSLAWKAQRPR